MENKNKVILGDNMDIMPTLEEGSVDAVITDPPYGISIKDASWDKAVPLLIFGKSACAS